MANTIVNPTGETNIFNVSGTALTAKTDIKSSTITGPGTVSTSTATVSVATNKYLDDQTGSKSLAGYTDLISLSIDTQGQLGTGKYGDLLELTLLSTPTGVTFAKGDFIYTDKGHTAQILDVISQTEFVTSIPYATRTNYITSAASYIPKNAVKQTTEGEYIGILLDADLDGGATSPNRANNKMEVSRTTKTGTAIRAGYMNVLSNEFTTAPDVVNDTSALGITSDKAPTSTHRVTYMIGGVVPTTVTN